MKRVTRVLSVLACLVVATAYSIPAFAAEADSTQTASGKTQSQQAGSNASSLDTIETQAQETSKADSATATVANAATEPTTTSSTETKAVTSSKTVKKVDKRTPSEKARADAVTWALAIAKDNSFHYGKRKWAQHSGCYFCGTNQNKKSLKRKAGASKSACLKTYCCNTFVTAAYTHGAKAKEVNCKVKSKRINLANNKNKALNNKKAFKRISKPKKITSLKPGDVLLTKTHAMLYAGGGKVVEAAHHDNGKKNSYWNDSIRHKRIAKWQWKRVCKIYRYVGRGKY